ncbi:MAG: cupin domain-containing protein [Gemmataceae bacterium]|nr:cupin domain-containing protein [Gemmataceae bacterium]
MESSCELPGPGGASASSRVTAAGSRLHRFLPGEGGAPHAWSGVPLQEYKTPAAHHCGVTRSVLVGESGESTRFHLRYFEIAPGGFSTLERHRHEHVVVVLRGRGTVRLGETTHEVGHGDTVYVAPGEVHQLRNAGEEPFGFLCLVDAERDRPEAVEG